VGCVRLRQVWRQAAGVGVGEGGRRGGGDSGAPGPAPGRCEAGLGARAPSSRGVLRLKPPQPRELRGFSTYLAHCSGGPRQQPSSAPPVQSTTAQQAFNPSYAYAWLSRSLYGFWAHADSRPSGARPLAASEAHEVRESH
jgi:hypothetical protein